MLDSDFFSNNPAHCAPDGEAASLLSVQGLSHTWGSEQVLDGLSFNVAAGKIACLLGASGSGKSTTLRLIAGLERLQAGRIDIGGRNVASPGMQVPAQDRSVGLMFQDYALFPHMRAWQNVAYGLHRLPRTLRKKRAMELLDEVSMADLADAFPQQLSGGQQQRVALARALAPEPKVLLLDEPFSGLDGGLRSRLRDMTLHVVKERNIAAIVVTHDADEALFMADWIVLIEKGHLLQQGLPSQIYYEPRSPEVVKFFGDVNRLDGWVEAGRIQTLLGPVSETKLPAGTQVDVYARPEAIRICPVAMQPGETLVEIRAARALGRQSVLHMDVVDVPQQHIHARIAGQFLPKEGSQFGVGLDASMTYVFPRDA